MRRSTSVPKAAALARVRDHHEVILDARSLVSPIRVPRMADHYLARLFGSLLSNLRISPQNADINLEIDPESDRRGGLSDGQKENTGPVPVRKGRGSQSNLWIEASEAIVNQGWISIHCTTQIEPSATIPHQH